MSHTHLSTTHPQQENSVQSQTATVSYHPFIFSPSALCHHHLPLFIFFVCVSLVFCQTSRVLTPAGSLFLFFFLKKKKVNEKQSMLLQFPGLNLLTCFSRTTRVPSQPFLNVNCCLQRQNTFLHLRWKKKKKSRSPGSDTHRDLIASRGLQALLYLCIEIRCLFSGRLMMKMLKTRGWPHCFIWTNTAAIVVTDCEPRLFNSSVATRAPMTSSHKVVCAHRPALAALHCALCLLCK